MKDSKPAQTTQCMVGKTIEGGNLFGDGGVGTRISRYRSCPGRIRSRVWDEGWVHS